MKPSDASAKIRAALWAIIDWNPDDEPWPAGAVEVARDAVYELAQAGGSVGTASERPEPAEVGAFGITTWVHLNYLSRKAEADLDARVRLAAELGILACELLEPVADIGAGTSQRQQKRSKKPRYQKETREQLDTAREIHSGSDRDGAHPGQFETVAEVAREVGRQLYGDDEANWTSTLQTIYRRLWRHPERWKRDAQPADAEPG